MTSAVDSSTDAVVERYQYTPYGEVTFLEPDFDTTSATASAIGNQHLYTGRERDPESGLQLNRSRYYASHLGRWLSRDPFGYGGGPNLYQYVAGIPTFYVDPSGLKTIYMYPDSCDEDDFSRAGEDSIPAMCKLLGFECASFDGVDTAHCILCDACDDPEDPLKDVHIRTHGSSGSVQFCNNCGERRKRERIGAGNLRDVFGDVDFPKGCVIYIETCRSGAGPSGQELVDAIAEATGCLVVANSGECCTKSDGSQIPNDLSDNDKPQRINDVIGYPPVTPHPPGPPSH